MRKRIAHGNSKLGNSPSSQKKTKSRSKSTGDPILNRKWKVEGIIRVILVLQTFQCGIIGSVVKSCPWRVKSGLFRKLLKLRKETYS